MRGRGGILHIDERKYRMDLTHKNKVEIDVEREL